MANIFMAFSLPFAFGFISALFLNLGKENLFTRLPIIAIGAGMAIYSPTQNVWIMSLGGLLGLFGWIIFQKTKPAKHEPMRRLNPDEMEQ